MVSQIVIRNRRKLIAAGLGALVLLGAGTAQAQRDPAYSAARAAGTVGEGMDGYLGFVTPPSPQLRALIEDINLKRRTLYTKQAQGKGSVSDYAFVAGCQQIADTQPGEKYQAPGGNWVTRTSAPPQRHPKCL